MGDVTVADQVTEFVESAAAAMGGIDILVNNAAGPWPGQFGTLTDDDWHADIEVKLFSQIRCIRAALPHLRRSQAARVININALYARYPDPVFLASSVNRASCLSLSKALSIELGQEGILVNSVNIGLGTPLSGRTFTACGRPIRLRRISSASSPPPKCRWAGSVGQIGGRRPRRLPGQRSGQLHRRCLDRRGRWHGEGPLAWPGSRVVQLPVRGRARVTVG